MARIAIFEIGTRCDTWVENLETSKGKYTQDDDRHSDHDKDYVQSYIKQYGGRKVEANALVVRPEAGRELCLQTILKYLPEDAPEDYEAELQPCRDELEAAIREEFCLDGHPDPDTPPPDDSPPEPPKPPGIAASGSKMTVPATCSGTPGCDLRMMRSDDQWMTTPTPGFGLRLPQDILDCIDRHRMALPYPPSRSAVLRKVVQDWADSQTPKRRVTLEEEG